MARANPWTVLFYGFLFGGVFLAAVGGSQGATVPALPVQEWLRIAALAAFPSILAYGLYLMALRRLETGRAAILATLEPALASLWAWLALGEGLEPTQVVGSS